MVVGEVGVVGGLGMVVRLGDCDATVQPSVAPSNKIWIRLISTSDISEFIDLTAPNLPLASIQPHLSDPTSVLVSGEKRCQRSSKTYPHPQWHFILETVVILSYAVSMQQDLPISVENIALAQEIRPPPEVSRHARILRNTLSLQQLRITQWNIPREKCFDNPIEA